ncbi:GNAT family N-acetyltransferase [Kitasatospora sp. MBT63]|uniref:GNAT family N-acetyltransferase n=1 Tax=Kitasatospora sp. MBT63 TaxID=1444768 RepID=UPI00053AC5FC|nr:GNAT family N-acetyltransferase [Kitasatospora sp. MBT63]
MTWTVSSSPTEFHTGAGQFLAAHRAENTVLLTLAHRLGRDGLHVFGPQPPRFGWWRAEGAESVGAAFLWTPPFPLRLGRMPVTAAGELATVLHGQGERPSGVGGAKAAVAAFTEVWQRLTGAATEVEVEERLYRLGELTPPTPAGPVRPARPAEHGLLTRWSEAFFTEVGVPPVPDIPGVIAGRIADGTLHVREDGGRPVSMAGVSPVLAGMSRIGPVYTPPELRGRGYAGGVVAAGCARAVAAGAVEVLLYTDLANPTSNSLYQRLGFRAVEDCVVLKFT